MERGIQCGSLTAMLHIAAALRMETAELVRLIEAEMRAGPCPPERGAASRPSGKKARRRGEHAGGAEQSRQRAAGGCARDLKRRTLSSEAQALSHHLRV